VLLAPDQRSAQWEPQPDARAIGDALTERRIKLSLGGLVYDPSDRMGMMFFNILATFAECEVDLLRMRTREGMTVAQAKGKLRGKQPKLSPKTDRTAPDARHQRVQHQRSRRVVLHRQGHRLPDL
jgi:DNA invertase Pin-like site-specific DNA recombinase